MQKIKLYNAHCCGEVGDVVIEIDNLIFLFLLIILLQIVVFPAPEGYEIIIIFFLFIFSIFI